MLPSVLPDTNPLHDVYDSSERFLRHLMLHTGVSPIRTRLGHRKFSVILGCKVLTVSIILA